MFKNIKTKKNIVKSIALFFILFFSIAMASSAFNAFKFKENTLNLIHISDVHFDSKSKSTTKRMFEDSGNLLKDAISQINSLTDTDLVVFSGDVVNKSDKNEFLKFLNIANELKAPKYYAAGNHDIGIFGGISKQEAIKFWLGNSKLKDLRNIYFNNQNSNSSADSSIYYSLSPNRNFLVIFLDGVIDNEITANGYFPTEELKWLDEQLKNNPDKKVIIVQHYPVVEPFKSSSHKVRNDDEYFKTIDKYKNVVAVLSGHYHSTKITQRKNVLHISTPALVEYPNSFRQIKITSLKDSTKFDIKFIETGLKNVQQLSKSRSKNIALQEGQEKDRNAVIILNQQNKEK